MNYEKGQKLAHIELGRFLATFEHTTHYFKDCIQFILEDNGLKNSDYAEILLNRLTAEPVKSILQGMIAYRFSDNNQSILNKVITQYSYLIEIRNVVIHSYWAIGVGIEEDKSVSLIGIKTRNSKKGITHFNLDLELEDFHEINEMNENFCMLICDLKNTIVDEEDKIKTLCENGLQEIDFKILIQRFKETNSK